MVKSLCTTSQLLFVNELHKRKHKDLNKQDWFFLQPVAVLNTQSTGGVASTLLGIDITHKCCSNYLIILLSVLLLLLMLLLFK